MKPRRYAHTKIDDITDQNLQALFDEIVEIRGESKGEHQVIQFLDQALHTFHQLEPQKYKKFAAGEMLPHYTLVKRIKDLAKTEIYWLCHDLVDMFNMGHLENFHGKKLYLFINKGFSENEKQKKRLSRKNPRK